MWLEFRRVLFRSIIYYKDNYLIKLLYRQQQTMNNAKFSNLFSLATKARNNAYAPYSKFSVGAAIETINGKTYTGCNVENVSYPCGTCAEAGAISAMIADGENKIKNILIIADSKDLITPCGACLQRISEFATKDTLVILANLKEIKKEIPFCDFLPHNFTNLEQNND